MSHTPADQHPAARAQSTAPSEPSAQSADVADPAPRAPAPAAIHSAIHAALMDSALPEEVGHDGDAPATPPAATPGADAWDDAAAFMADIAMDRADGRAIVVLESLPPSRGGGSARRMRLGIVNDDMPFLVDSVAGAVAASGLAVHRIIHPVVAARRDGAGRLT
ncbi:MAG: hypothetical protein ACKOUM_08820, partial [Sphingopyxis sp.]